MKLVIKKYLALFSVWMTKRSILKNGLKEYVLEQNGFRFHFYDNKSPQPVIVLLNGLGITTEFQWNKVVPRLAKTHRVVLVNILHFGKSGSTIVNAYDVQDQVRFLKALFDKLSIDKAKVAGISYGGFVVAEFTEKYPDLVTQQFLLNAPVKYMDVQLFQSFCAKYGVENVNDFFAPKDFSGYVIQHKTAHFKTPFIPELIIEALYDYICKPCIEDWEKLVVSLIAQQSIYQKKEYSFSGKTTIVWGEDDQVVPLEVGIRLNDHYVNSELHVLKKCGHIPSMEKYREVVELLNMV